MSCRSLSFLRHSPYLSFENGSSTSTSPPPTAQMAQIFRDHGRVQKSMGREGRCATILARPTSGIYRRRRYSGLTRFMKGDRCWSNTYQGYLISALNRPGLRKRASSARYIWKASEGRALHPGRRPHAVAGQGAHLWTSDSFFPIPPRNPPSSTLPPATNSHGERKHDRLDMNRPRGRSIPGYGNSKTVGPDPPRAEVLIAQDHLDILRNFHHIIINVGDNGRTPTSMEIGDHQGYEKERRAVPTVAPTTQGGLTRGSWGRSTTQFSATLLDDQFEAEGGTSRGSKRLPPVNSRSKSCSRHAPTARTGRESRPPPRTRASSTYRKHTILLTERWCARRVIYSSAYQSTYACSCRANLLPHADSFCSCA